MRRSKSNPAKYARNYRSISQRRMTEHEDVDEEQEMERLRSILRNSKAHLGSTDGSEEASIQKNKNSKRPRAGEESNGIAESSIDKADDLATSILSKEMQVELGVAGDQNPLVLLPKKKKARHSKPRVELTPQEIRQAKALQKKTERKLKQLSDRSVQKKRRQELYTKLEKSAISSEEMQLLSSSSTLGKKETKRETLKRLLQRERAGIELTEEERALLYQESNPDDGGRPFPEAAQPTANATVDASADPATAPDGSESNGKTKKQRKRKKKLIDAHEKALIETDEHAAMTANAEAMEKSSSSDQECQEKAPEGEAPPEEKSTPSQSTETEKANALDFASQMMASLTSLKAKTSVEKQENEQLEQQHEEEARQADENEERHEKRRYVPTNPAVLKSAARIGLEPNHSLTKSRRVLPVERPQEVKDQRYDLPVSGMEFEIIDAVRNNDVVILCSETGSGKSTQVPQFLYEAGMTLNEDAKVDNLTIGITQPRRVAAVSTAKRVCYEMGHGNGQSISNGPNREGNLVAYQTRYETAGLGGDTRIKFMTDGILLQEIQSDLLLRKYGAIVLDEAHERNLNTDVLLGLLSVAVPLRRKASMEEGSGILPLKLIVMSATLRVEDFIENDRLFPAEKPKLVTVPGRTHPVTIHHSKVTELDDYESVALSKICKIHRKLPKGGILVFLTGRQEIVRMVKRLQRALGNKNLVSNSTKQDVSVDEKAEFGAPRDMDDDEMDGDFFAESEGNDDFDDMEDGIEDNVQANIMTGDAEEDNIPKFAHILPLYSMLSAEEQAKVFAPVPEGHRLIVVATNIAETSITIPGISYVVDTGRQKCRNHHAGTGIASYDVMWISKAAADQRAGRAGRTGPGHCYRLYSSSMYARHMNAFALPEVLTRPLEDVVLAMKAMNVTNVAKFPFPTAPDQGQLDAAVKVLANIGCVDLSHVEERGGDGEITRLGAAVAKLPLGVRYGKILLVAAQAGVLDYGIVLVAALSESSPFRLPQETTKDNPKPDDAESLDEIDRSAAEKQKQEELKSRSRKWMHKGGDILAAMLAVGAYTYAGRGAGGAAERLACRNFCEQNGLNAVVMERIQKMRRHLARLAKTRFSNAEGIASKTGGVLNSMPPPSKVQERSLIQAIVSGLLDNVAILAPHGSITGDYPAFTLRSAYLSCSSTINEPLLLDQNSVLHSRDSRLLPEWVCYDSIIRKTAKDGRSVMVMKNVTPVDPSWLGVLARNSRMLSLGEPLPSPLPSYDAQKDAILCSVVTKFGSRGWEIPPAQVEMFEALQKDNHNRHFLKDDSFRWFARFLLEGKVIPEFKPLLQFWSDEPAVITRKTPMKKVALLVAALSSAGVDSAAALRKHWAEVDNKFLFKEAKSWTKPEHATEVKRIWIDAVKRHVRLWNERCTGKGM